MLIGGGSECLVKANVTPIFKKGNPGNYRPANLTTVSGKLMEQILLKDISKYMKDKKVTGNSQHRFIKGKSCLTDCPL